MELAKAKVVEKRYWTIEITPLPPYNSGKTCYKQFETATEAEVYLNEMVENELLQRG